MNLGDIPRRNSNRYPDKTAIIFKDQSLTWREVNNRVNALVHALQAQGFKKGDRLGILMQNRLQYWEIYWAAAKAGIWLALKNQKLLSLWIRCRKIQVVKF